MWRWRRSAGHPVSRQDLVGGDEAGPRVREPHARGQAVYEAPGAAVFTAEFELDAPKVLEFIGEGPLGYEHAMQRAVKRMLVVPGEDILGDGVLLELHGFIVELIEPKTPASGGTVTVTARVRLLCGCPPGGALGRRREVSRRGCMKGLGSYGRLSWSMPGSQTCSPVLYLSRMQARTPGWWCSPTTRGEFWDEYGCEGRESALKS